MIRQFHIVPHINRMDNDHREYMHVHMMTKRLSDRDLDRSITGQKRSWSIDHHFYMIVTSPETNFK